MQSAFPTVTNAYKIQNANTRHKKHLNINTQN